MNIRKLMAVKAKKEIHKRYMRNGGWVDEVLKIARADDRKPHEKVVDTTFERAPEFYGSLTAVVSIDPQADCKKGLEHLYKREYREAHACFLFAARSGSAEGQYRLGSLYLYGRGVKADYNLAECWFREAAKNGYLPHALDTLKMIERFREKDKKQEGGETDE